MKIIPLKFQFGILAAGICAIAAMGDTVEYKTDAAGQVSVTKGTLPAYVASGKHTELHPNCSYKTFYYGAKSNLAKSDQPPGIVMTFTPKCGTSPA